MYAAVAGNPDATECADSRAFLALVLAQAIHSIEGSGIASSTYSLRRGT
jgi:hypothetical protein